MTVKLLLDKKREGRELDSAEISELVSAYSRGDVPDYQMAAFAMAVCCRGMGDGETLALTEAMRDSGVCLSWDLPATADKHSTGGVGDKLSLVVQPLAAACGLSVPSLAGRGLGLTGGTVDKMESIPGYVATLSLGAFRKVVEDCGCSIAAQTEEIAPADRRLYALRDVTGTVPSIPLIVSSILSKKLAEGARTLVFDVKCGRGAFMRTADDARALASALVRISKGAGRRAVALVTAMDEPLGFAVGNALEVEEAVDVMRDPSSAPADVRDLSVELAARMVSLELGEGLDAARARCRERLADGSAYRRFVRMVEMHGGSLGAFRMMRKAFSGTEREVVADRDGFVGAIDAQGVARAAFALGAGRAKTGDAIDMSAGVRLLVAHGERVERGRPLARLYATDRPECMARAMELVYSAIGIDGVAPGPKPLAMEVVE